MSHRAERTSRLLQKSLGNAAAGDEVGNRRGRGQVQEARTKALGRSYALIGKAHPGHLAPHLDCGAVDREGHGHP